MNAAPNGSPAPASARLVIGIGNEFRGDDGVGLSIAQKLRAMAGLGARVVESSGGGTELMGLWAGAELAILIDAVHSGGRPGSVFRYVLPDDEIPGAIFPRHSTHAFGVLEALELAATLGERPPRVIVYGIEGESFATGAGLSGPVRAAASEVVDMVVRDLFEDRNTQSKGGRMDVEAKIEELIARIEEHAEENDAIKVIEVRLRVGALADIDVDDFRDDFAEALFGTVADGARINIEVSTDRDAPDAGDIVLKSAQVE